MKELVKCPNCGKQNKITSKFCKDCGTTLSDTTNTSEPNKEVKSSSGGIMDSWNKQSTTGKAIIGVAGICCIGLILIIGISGMMAPDKTTSSATADTTADTNTNDDTTNDTTDTSSDTSDTSTDSKFSGLNHPSAVESVLSQFDYNYDNRIEFVDEDSSNPDGQEEYARWAVAAGFDSSDAKTLTYMFNEYDANGDGYWDIYELDNFYDDYYKN